MVAKCAIRASSEPPAGMVSAKASWRRVLEDVVIVWVALAAASAMSLLTLRSMAFAMVNAVDARRDRPCRPVVARSAPARARRGYVSSHEVALLLVEIALSFGIALTSIGLASMAALSGRLLIGALLAQVAVLGSLVAPAVTVDLRGLAVRPAALALGVAQLANLIFFVKAIQALV